MKKGNYTKQQILREAIELFSKKGYSAVSVRDISKAVGIRESSIYNHFQNKQDILDQIIASYTEDLESFMLSEKLVPPQQDADGQNSQADYFGIMRDELFVSLAAQVFRKMYLDEKILKLWRILSIERFNNAQMDGLYRKFLLEDVLKYQSAMFSLLMEKGLIRKADPEMLAIEFYAPAFLLYQRYFATGFEDLQDEGRKRIEDLFIQHVLYFRESNKQHLARQG